MIYPLSVFTYYRYNLARVGIVVGSMLISILAIVSISALTASFRADADLSGGIYTRYATLSLAGSPQILTQATTKARQELDLLGYFSRQEGGVLYSNKVALAGRVQAPFVFVSTSDYSQHLKLVGAKLVTGKLPSEGTNEVVVSAQYLINHHLAVGDAIGTDVWAFDYLPGRFVVVGTFDRPPGISTPLFNGMGNLSYYGSLGLNTTNFIVDATSTDSTQLQSNFDKIRTTLSKTYPSVTISQTTYQDFEGRENDNFRFMNTMVWSIMGILTIAITLSLTLFMIIVFMQRAGEFGLLEALGYSKSFIIRKTLLESFGQVLAGWILGVVAAYGLAALINQILFYPNEFSPLAVFTTRSLSFTLPALLAVIILSAWVVVIRLRKLDPITILEKRD